MPARPPPEWSPHAAVWIGWPSHAHLWEADLDPARAEVVALVRAIRDNGRGEAVHLLAANAPAADAVKTALAGDVGVQVHIVPFGDIWLRDTGPIFLASSAGVAAAGFRWNGWGGKYHLDHDDAVSRAVAGLAETPFAHHDWVLEGGAIDGDGTGLVVTTEQCVLNPNRNPHLTRGDAEHRLRLDLGLDRVLWLGDGLLNDHTDGHVDNLARFVGAGVLALPDATGAGDPNRDAYADAYERAHAFGVDIARVPSPGLVTDDDGEIVPASYMNFYIANTVVVVPTHGAPNDEAAVAAIGALFPGRRAIGLPTRHILTGGGSFHCITQQQPA